MIVILCDNNVEKIVPIESDYIIKRCTCTENLQLSYSYLPICYYDT